MDCVCNAIINKIKASFKKNDLRSVKSVDFVLENIESQKKLITLTKNKSEMISGQINQSLGSNSKKFLNDFKGDIKLLNEYIGLVKKGSLKLSKDSFNLIKRDHQVYKVLLEDNIKGLSVDFRKHMGEYASIKSDKLMNRVNFEVSKRKIVRGIKQDVLKVKKGLQFGEMTKLQKKLANENESMIADVLESTLKNNGSSPGTI